MMATNLLLADLFSLVLTDKLVATRTLPFILKHVASPYVFHMKREDLRILRLWACIDSNAFGKFVGNMDLIYLDITNMEWTTGQVQAAIATFIQVIARRPEFVCEQIVLYIDGPRHYKESLEIMECISTKPSIKSLSIQFISDLDGWDLGPTSITPLKYERLPLQYLKHFEVRAPIWSNWTPGSFREFLNMFQCGNIESFTVAGRMGKDWPQGFFERHPQISDIFIDPGELFYFAADYSDLTKHVTIPSPYSLIPLSIPENPRVCLMNCGTISVLRGTTLNILPYLQHLKNSHIAANKITTLVIHDVPDVDTTDFVQSVVQCVNLCPNLSALKIGYRILRQFSVQEFYNDKQDFTVTLCNKDLQNVSVSHKRFTFLTKL